MNKLKCHFLKEDFEVFNLKAVYSYFFIYMFFHSFILKLWHRWMYTSLKEISLFPCRTVNQPCHCLGQAARAGSSFGQTMFETRDCSRKMGTHGWIPVVNAVHIWGIQM